MPGGRKWATHGSVSLLGFALLLGEEDEFGLVLLQPLYVLLQGFHRFVPASEIHRDADAACRLLADASSLQKIKTRHLFVSIHHVIICMHIDTLTTSLYKLAFFPEAKHLMRDFLEWF